MVVATRQKRQTTHRFAALMELYEKNYMQVRLLLPGLRSMEDGVYVSSVEKGLDLELSDLEQNRYTSTFNLTYRFKIGSRREREPDLNIRLYHDARTCEVVSGLLRLKRMDNRRTRELDDCWRQNRFLYKWISYCIRQGHSFDQPPSLSAIETSSHCQEK